MRTIWRILLEAAFILLLFYTNLLMGEFTRDKIARGVRLSSAIRNVVTPENFAIGLLAALAGYLIVEVLRRRL